MSWAFLRSSQHTPWSYSRLQNKKPRLSLLTPLAAQLAVYLTTTTGKPSQFTGAVSSSRSLLAFIVADVLGAAAFLLWIAFAFDWYYFHGWRKYLGGDWGASIVLEFKKWIIWKGGGILYICILWRRPELCILILWRLDCRACISCWSAVGNCIPTKLLNCSDEPLWALGRVKSMQKAAQWQGTR